MARPREFDPDAALDRAVNVFWEHGYEGSSMAQLTAAMGINKPSLYAAFGDKRQLFEKAVRRYAEGGPAWERDALSLPTARAAVTTFLHRTVDVVTGGDHPLGCLIEQGASKCAPENRPVRDFVAAQRTEVLRFMEQRFRRAVSDADPTMRIDPAMLALLTVAIGEGITSRANDGTPPGDLHAMVDVVTAGLFSPSGPQDGCQAGS